MVPNKEEDYILLLGYSISYKEYYLTRFNHQKNTTQMNLSTSGWRLRAEDFLPPWAIVRVHEL